MRVCIQWWLWWIVVVCHCDLLLRVTLHWTCLESDSSKKDARDPWETHIFCGSERVAATNQRLSALGVPTLLGSSRELECVRERHATVRRDLPSPPMPYGRRDVVRAR